jgi:membrane-associated phospholipid phosphatase
MTPYGIVYCYFGALALLPWGRPLPVRRRVEIAAMAVTVCVATWWLSRNAPAAVRDAAPLALILIGYYLSGLFFVRPTERFESWLIAWDRRLLGDPTTRFAHWPRAWLAFLDIIYMGCFLLVPAGFAVLRLGGSGDNIMLVDRYWTIVMAAEFGAFLPLTVVQSRPPWAVEREAALRDRAVHRAASRFVREVTIRANTFPSGHASGSVAVALALIGPLPVVGAVFLALAFCISLACIVGRYHYVIDAVAGVMLAFAIWLVVVAVEP